MKELKQETRQEIDALTPEEISRKNSHAYEHEILWYGLDGFAHFWLMKKAGDFVEEGRSVQELQERYGIKRGNERMHPLARYQEHAFFFPLSKVTQDGMYIPRHAIDKQLVLFDGSDIPVNRRFEYPKVKMLCYRVWSLDDFANRELIEQGQEFGKELWKSAIIGFHEYKNGNERMNKQPEKVTRLGEELIEYYSSIISGG
jgi:hypothetical protein